MSARTSRLVQRFSGRRADLLWALADEIEIAHVRRFGKVATGYPRRVNEAYGWDREAALIESDAAVASQSPSGSAPTDWR